MLERVIPRNRATANSIDSGMPSSRWRLDAGVVLRRRGRCRVISGRLATHIGEAGIQRVCLESHKHAPPA
jgi:hypothetical protein